MIRASLSEELDFLLSESIEKTKKREQTYFDNFVNEYQRPILLFGAGNLGKKILKQLRKDDIKPIAFIDNSANLWGKYIEGLLVLSPEEAAKKYAKKAIFIVTIWSPKSNHQFKLTKEKLFSLGCRHVISFLSIMWKYSEEFLPNFFIDLPHKIILEKEIVKKAYSIWADVGSKYTYLSQLKWRILESFDGLPERIPEKQYFCHFFTLNNDEVFVDCGAYNGDTIKDFIGESNDVKEIHAFEPDPINFQKLSSYVESLPIKNKINLYQKAVGSRYEKLMFSCNGNESSSLSENGQSSVESIPLDSALDEYQPTFIKMDIEGAEEDALYGAQNTIKNNLPILAICVYHRQSHLWKIPLFLNDLSDKYNFFLRAHDNEGWDLVCYAVPKNRLIKSKV